jgi:hypothetical protein
MTQGCGTQTRLNVTKSTFGTEDEYNKAHNKIDRQAASATPDALPVHRTKAPLIRNETFKDQSDKLRCRAMHANVQGPSDLLCPHHPLL